MFLNFLLSKSRIFVFSFQIWGYGGNRAISHGKDVKSLSCENSGNISWRYHLIFVPLHCKLGIYIPITGNRYRVLFLRECVFIYAWRQRNGAPKEKALPILTDRKGGLDLKKSPATGSAGEIYLRREGSPLRFQPY